MARYKIVKLNFTSPLHIGRGLGEAYDTAEKTLHSDTISGALASVFCTLNKEADVIGFMDKFRVSSAFPYMDDICFLPKPLVKTRLSIEDEDDYLQKKKLKKIEYIESSVWQEVISGREVKVRKEQLSVNGKFLFAQKAPEKMPFKDEVQQRVTVPRFGGESKPYYLDRRFFAVNSGLFFFVSTDSDTEKLIDKLLGFLGSTGFGTDKSVGNGQFEYEFSEIDLQVPEGSPKSMLLSLACPLREELSVDILEKSTYQLVNRGGFIAGTSENQFRHLRKKSLYMFTEGSVLGLPEMKGKIENVRPAWNDSLLHPVYRDGRAFCLPVNI